VAFLRERLCRKAAHQMSVLVVIARKSPQTVHVLLVFVPRSSVPVRKLHLLLRQAPDRIRSQGLHRT
jgi:hypothetical protein